MTTSLPELVYLVKPLLPAHRLSLFSGPAQGGKSRVLATLVAALQRGTPFYSLETQLGLSLAYVIADHPRDEYETLWARAGVDLAQLRTFFLCGKGLDPRLADSYRRAPRLTLYRILEDLLPVDLILLEPFDDLLSCNVNNYWEVRPRMVEMQNWCLDHEVTILGTHHTAKARSDYHFQRFQDKASGSMALQGFSGTQLIIDTPSENGTAFHRLYLAPRLEAARTIFLQEDPQTGLLAYRHTLTDAAALDGDLSTRILTLLATRQAAIKREEIQVALDDVSPRTLTFRLRRLLHEGAIFQPRFGWYALKRPFTTLPASSLPAAPGGGASPQASEEVAWLVAGPASRPA